MSVHVLVSGSLWKNPEQRSSSKTGKIFTVATIKVGSDDSASADFWSVLCFSESAQLELLRLEAGDAVSCRGKLELKTYTAADGTTKIGRTVFADSALGLRPVPRTSKAKAAKPAETSGFSAKPTSQETTTTTTSTATDSDLNDPIPF